MRKILTFFFSHRTLALLRWDIHFIKIRFINLLFFKKNYLMRLLNRKKDKIYLNLGSGPRGIDNGEWINIDGFHDKNVHFCCDFSRRLPFDKDTFDAIFCEHVLEHFDLKNGTQLLSECLRILKPSGIIRIIVPDGNKILKSYFDSPEFIVNYKQCENHFPMEAINIWFYQRYEHQCIYDADYILGILNKVGFSDSSRVSFKDTKFGDKSVLMDDEKYMWESLYVEAKK